MPRKIADEELQGRLLRANQILESKRNRLRIEPGIDRRELARRLRQGGDITPRERDLLADLVEGKPTKPRHRPEAASTAIQQDAIARFYLFLQAAHPERQAKSIRSEIEKQFGVSGRTVSRALKRLRGSPERYAAIKDLYEVLEPLLHE